jgi:hypothetical protein
MKTSACGLICEECHFYQKECNGCYQVKGKPFWTADENSPDICPLYDCSINKKGLENCGKCKELPCNLYFELKDPNITEEVHLQTIQIRVSNLRN